MNIAIPFYTRDNFVKITSILPNSDWPKTYEDWLAKTETGERGVKLSGNIPVRVDVEPSAFEAWCKNSKQPVVRNSILGYCGYILGLRLMKSSDN